MTDTKVFEVTLLYVEDEAGTREQLADFLRRRVRTLLVATNGQEGLDMYRQHRPDIVVTDIRMPFLDGLSMARQIKAIDSGALVVMTTAHSDTNFLLESIETDIDGYVLKPVETRQLLAVIAKLTAALDLRREAQAYHQERERLVVELQAALAKVKLLSGFLPICAACKKIRDDQGYWQQIEAYVRDHSEAEFTHSICPDCVRRLYPEVHLPEHMK